MRGKTEKKISKIMCVVLDIQVVVASSEQRAGIIFDITRNMSYLLTSRSNMFMLFKKKHLKYLNCVFRVIIFCALVYYPFHQTFPVFSGNVDQ